jgi:putative protein-disulfide isomerase
MDLEIGEKTTGFGTLPSAIRFNGMVDTLEDNSEEMKLFKLVYIGDPMCSWCYGFSKEIKSIAQELRDEVDFEMIMGGLRPFNQQKIASMKSFLSEHWKQVESATQMPFSYEILDHPTMVYDTEPACRAAVTMRFLEPLKELEYFSAVQTAFYVKNLDINKAETYVQLAEEVGIYAETFKANFESDAMKVATKSDFEKAASLGVSGFPSVVLEHNNQLHLITNGYTTASKMLEKIDKILKRTLN